jgi:probable DNA metabolism protein
MPRPGRLVFFRRVIVDALRQAGPMQPHEEAPDAPAPGAPDRADASPRSVTLVDAIDRDGFRLACRALWSEQIAPERVSWHVANDSEADLFEATQTRLTATSASPLQVPPSFMPLCESAILHSDPGRFGLLYRLLWRLQTEPGLRHDPLDADCVTAQHLSQAVRRDMHKMKAFVRFRTIEGDVGLPPMHVAWFEPEHHIVEATAPFFARRFTTMRWVILTPLRSVRWDGTQLTLGPPARRDQAPPADAGEKLWLTYYESIFNPARLKVKAMQKEMPKRYWPNLPEARLIDPLVAGAAERSENMIQRGPSASDRRRPALNRPGGASDEATSGSDALSLLPALRDALERCRECPIGTHATRAVPGEGPAGARWMFVGEQPGD